jgi:hypothetical protein
VTVRALPRHRAVRGRGVGAPRTVEQSIAPAAESAAISLNAANDALRAPFA